MIEYIRMCIENMKYIPNPVIEQMGAARDRQRYESFFEQCRRDMHAANLDHFKESARRV